MAKITLADGMVIEGTIEELKQMGVKFPVETSEIEQEPLKVGDYAKVSNHVSHDGYAGAGDIVELHSNDGGFYDFKVVKLTDRSDCTLFDRCSLTRATDEEVAEVKAKLEFAEKWAKIGRKPNEFKAGDAVRYKNAFTTVVVVIPGLIRINQSSNVDKHIAVNPSELTLVFPAEARFE
jgi:hypothetical protein